MIEFEITLSENPEYTVCLIEAGGSDRDLRVRVPAGILALYGRKRFDYCYTSVPQPELNNRNIPVNRGKVLGGSSSINSMVYIRGSASDYDAWSELGCDGWSYKDVLQIFKALERNQLGQDAEYHGFNGELLVDNPRDHNVMSDVFVSAGESIGLPANTDFNGPSQTGLGVYNVTQDKGRRFSSYTAFVKPVEGRKNLTILTGADVRKINFDNRQATGLRIAQDGQEKLLTCKREIVLSAGAINSPTLLLQSGIGPAEELSKQGIDPVVDVAGVGKNLQDHIDGMITVRSASSKTLGISMPKLPAILSSPFNYLPRRRR
ncbi:MAG: GMC family oxidoreductase N-terminal domain-containing protein, partial [Pseudomonadota bacterium]